MGIEILASAPAGVEALGAAGIISPDLVEGPPAPFFMSARGAAMSRGAGGLDISPPPLPLVAAATSAAPPDLAATTATIGLTIYPDTRTGELAAPPTAISIDARSPHLRELKAHLEIIFNRLPGDNETPPAVKAQLTAELKAGVALLDAPTADKGALYTYIVRPLRWIAGKLVDVAIHEAAKAALAAFLTLVTASPVGGGDAQKPSATAPSTASGSVLTKPKEQHPSAHDVAQAASRRQVHPAKKRPHRS